MDRPTLAAYDRDAAAFAKDWQEQPAPTDLHGIVGASTKGSHKLLDGIPVGQDGLHAYFVHSYQLRPQDGSDLVAQADYGGPITAVVARGNVAGTQFHPEKSQKLGLALIANFLKWKP